MSIKAASDHHAGIIALAKSLTNKGLSVATAESCTGGGLGALLSSVPGSSDWFVGGIISYSNAVKVKLLQVPQNLLDSEGAVSESCARAMAQGGRDATGADLCISITGVAGPGGGNDDTPVGTVCFALASAQACESTTQHFGEIGRQNVRNASAEFALELIHKNLRSNKFL